MLQGVHISEHTLLMSCLVSYYVSVRSVCLGFPTIGKVTPTAPVTKSAVAKKKKRAKRPGQTNQWKHEETPLDEM